MTPRLQLATVWLIAAVVLGGALLAAQTGQNPLNDPDLAHQRPGFLDALGPPFPAPAVTGAIPRAGSRAVIFFTRPELAAPLSAALVGQPSLRSRAEVAMVVSGETPAGQVAGAPLVVDPSGRLAAAFKLSTPRDGGPPVGYAIVDRSGRVRYWTLDPFVTTQLEEVETMVKATP